MVTSSPHLSVAITCRGSDCSGSAVMGTLRTPGQAIFQVEATGAAAAAGCVSVCARAAGTHDEAMMLSKAKFTVIDLCTEAPSGFRWKNSTSPLQESSARQVCLSIERAYRFWCFVGQPSVRWCIAGNTGPMTLGQIEGNLAQRHGPGIPRDAPTHGRLSNKAPKPVRAFYGQADLPSRRFL